MISPLRILYLALALLGAGQAALSGALLLPWSLWPPDRIVAFAALAVWSLAETRVRRNWTALVSLPVAVVCGPGTGLALYLFLRTRPVG